VIDIRRLAAVDIVFLGSRFILTDFIVGIFGLIGLGILSTNRSPLLSKANLQ
jgi:hypothetical protein